LFFLSGNALVPGAAFPGGSLPAGQSWRGQARGPPCGVLAKGGWGVGGPFLVLWAASERPGLPQKGQCFAQKRNREFEQDQLFGGRMRAQCRQAMTGRGRQSDIRAPGPSGAPRGWRFQRQGRLPSKAGDLPANWAGPPPPGPCLWPEIRAAPRTGPPKSCGGRSFQGAKDRQAFFPGP